MSKFCVKVDLIQNAATAAKEYVKKKQQEAFERAVQKEMRGLFGFFKCDRIQAEKNVKDNVNPLTDTWSCFGWGTLQQAESLLKACSVCCQDTVELDKKDAAFVGKWGTIGRITKKNVL